ncbi:hypothetical protein TWF506_010484 [Arthrobotrys conoides]|uniref:Oxidoreductase molybdopterin-binding domain-containing protein n=1 Tax=Arthrobotrys conoides TaxID=74498 RepID=A0AAN8NKI9_9PEZI
MQSDYSESPWQPLHSAALLASVDDVDIEHRDCPISNLTDEQSTVEPPSGLNGRKKQSMNLIGSEKKDEGEQEQPKDHEKGQNNERETQKGSEADASKGKYGPEKQVLLEILRREKNYISSLKVSNGNKSAPRIEDRAARVIDEQDQLTPDNSLPRSSDLIRLTEKHSLNAEAHLSHLFSAGLIRPNELHYVCNHGSFPRIFWEFCKIDVEYKGNTASLSMDDLKSNYETINTPVLLACDGNRRKEFNMVRKTKGFNWGANWCR